MLSSGFAIRGGGRARSVSIHCASLALVLAMGAAAQAQVAPSYAPEERNVESRSGYTEQTGSLPDGTEYMIRVPDEWNGTLIRDLDYAQRISQDERSSRYAYLLENGYALAGTARHPLRAWQYDPAREIANLDLVLDRFSEEFGEAERVIQFGCSGGGHVSLAVAEDFSERIDGSVVLAAHTPVWLMNNFLDGWFILQTLLGEYYEEAGHGPASDLQIIDLPNDGSSNPSGHGMEGELPQAWSNAFEAANQSPGGRARMALAFAVAQWPVAMAEGAEQPDYSDLEALQSAIRASLERLSGSPGGEARILFENAAQGQQLSWNENVDYAQFFENANPNLQAAVNELYAQSDLTLEEDLARVNEANGVRASRHAVKYWSAPGRTAFGDPQIPVFRLHEVGDYQIPYSLMLGYEVAVEQNGDPAMLRTALIDSVGHCTEAAISTAESAAAVEVMMDRLDEGSWPETDAQALNERARSLDDSPARYIEVGDHDIPAFNRLWIPKNAGQ